MYYVLLLYYVLYRINFLYLYLFIFPVSLIILVEKKINFITNNKGENLQNDVLYNMFTRSSKSPRIQVIQVILLNLLKTSTAITLK